MPSTRAARATRPITARAAPIFTGLVEPTATSATPASTSELMMPRNVVDRSAVVQRPRESRSQGGPGGSLTSPWRARRDAGHGRYVEPGFWPLDSLDRLGYAFSPARRSFHVAPAHSHARRRS